MGNAFREDIEVRACFGEGLDLVEVLRHKFEELDEGEDLCFSDWNDYLYLAGKDDVKFISFFTKGYDVLACFESFKAHYFEASILIFL